MLLMLAGYAVATAAHLSLSTLVWGFGILVAGTMTVLTFNNRHLLTRPNSVYP
jgi:hypothetical protein